MIVPAITAAIGTVIAKQTNAVQLISVPNAIMDIIAQTSHAKQATIDITLAKRKLSENRIVAIVR
jgi:hypothetical protein